MNLLEAWFVYRAKAPIQWAQRSVRKAWRVLERELYEHERIKIATARCEDLGHANSRREFDKVCCEIEEARGWR